jgi:demethylmenaquinone methyltransferase/2-methoxy-6-polyprenyl-1,4-benzoquinol methylase
MKKDSADYGGSSYRRAYAVAAPIYDLLHVLAFALHGGRRKIWDRVIHSVSYQDGEKILDACCGTGYLERVFVESVGSDVEILGLDLSEDQIRVARKRAQLPNVEFVAGDARAIPFGDDHFDQCFMNFALHEMPPEVRKSVLAELLRVTKKDGRIVILEGHRPGSRFNRFLMYLSFFQWWPWCVDHPHSAEVWRSDYVSELEELGMTIASREVFGREFFQVIVAHP